MQNKLKLAISNLIEYDKVVFIKNFLRKYTITYYEFQYNYKT